MDTSNTIIATLAPQASSTAKTPKAMLDGKEVQEVPTTSYAVTKYNQRLEKMQNAFNILLKNLLKDHRVETVKPTLTLFEIAEKLHGKHDKAFNTFASMIENKQAPKEEVTTEYNLDTTYVMTYKLLSSETIKESNKNFNQSEEEIT